MSTFNGLVFFFFFELIELIFIFVFIHFISIHFIFNVLIEFDEIEFEQFIKINEN